MLIAAGLRNCRSPGWCNSFIISARLIISSHAEVERPLRLLAVFCHALILRYHIIVRDFDRLEVPTLHGHGTALGVSNRRTSSGTPLRDFDRESIGVPSESWCCSAARDPSANTPTPASSCSSVLLKVVDDLSAVLLGQRIPVYSMKIPNVEDVARHIHQNAREVDSALAAGSPEIVLRSCQGRRLREERPQPFLSCVPPSTVGTDPRAFLALRTANAEACLMALQEARHLRHIPPRRVRLPSHLCGS